MFNAEIKLVKEYMKFTDDAGDITEVQGIRIILAPKIEKFITMENLATGRKSNLELLGYVNPNLCQWYMNTSAGSEMILREKGSVERVPVRKETGITEIYKNSENQL